MEFRDNCAICRVKMTRSKVVKLQPCLHLLHEKCAEPILNVPNPHCPICRAAVPESIAVVRKEYKRNTNSDRDRIVTCASRGDDWVNLAKTLGINYKTAFRWVSSGRPYMLKKGGIKPKSLTGEEIDILISWVENSVDLTLQQIKNRIRNEFNKEVCVTTIGNYFEGRIFTLKQVHTEPINMNNEENRRRRAEYVHNLNNYIRDGKQVIWMDETNFNLFCRRTRGRSVKGSRAVQILPASRGPNVHLIGAISTAGVVFMERRRGSFTANLANDWVERLLIQWQNAGNEVDDLVIVCDNAPCHSRLEEAVAGSGATILRLPPYSPMLNPIENIWSKIKTFVKCNLRVPEVNGPGVVEQRLAYLEEIVDHAKTTINNGDCARAAQHSTTFYEAALAMEPMLVGQ